VVLVFLRWRTWARLRLGVSEFCRGREFYLGNLFFWVKSWGYGARKSLAILKLRFKLAKLLRKGGRVVEGAGLENQ